MTKEFSSIVELKSIREQKSRLSEREQELSSPILTDFTLIPEVYEWFRDILSGADCPPNPESVTQRKKFKSLTAKGLEFGENQVSPNNPKETQPLYYVVKFDELLNAIAS